MANKMADIHVKVDREIKAESEEVLKQIGISVSDLVNMTLRRVVYERRIPFDTRISANGAPEHLQVRSRKDLEKLLDAIAEEDDGTRLTGREVWGGLNEHMKNVSTGRQYGIRSEVHA